MAEYLEAERVRAFVWRKSDLVLSPRRFHLPGQHDQCDHSPTGECVEEDPEGPRAGMFRFEREIVRQTKETLGYFDKDGNLLQRIDGEESSVAVPESVVAKMRNKDTVMVHNHPTAGGGGGFSDIDLFVAISDNVAETRVVTENTLGKFTFIMKRPAGGWPSPNVVRAAVGEAKRQMFPVVNFMRNLGRISSLEANLAGWHSVAKLTADKLGLDYKMIRVRRRANA